MKVSLKNLKKYLKESRYAKNEAMLQSREAVWASVFADTIAGSTWFKMENISPGRWAVGYQYLYAMYRVLDEMHPINILELGLGQSTKMIGQYANHYNDVRHIVTESDPVWAAHFARTFILGENSELKLMDYVMEPYKDAEEVRVYQGFAEAVAGKKFDFISIDAPFAGDMQQYARIDVLRQMPDCLADSFVIMLDDYNRPPEMNTIEAMKAVLDEARISYETGVYRGAKECCLIASEDKRFFCSM